MRAAIAATALAVLAGCTTILDTQGSGSSPPGPGPLPGLPLGDSISAGGQVLFNPGNIRIFSDAETQSGVVLRPAQLRGRSAEYLVNLVGITLLISEQPVLAIDAFDVQQRLACGLEIGGGEFRLVSAGGTDPIGSYSGNADQHVILMRLSRKDDRCFVNIRQFPLGADTNAPQTQPPINAAGDFVDSAFDSLTQLRVAWEQSPPDTPTSYFIGRAVITARN